MSQTLVHPHPIARSRRRPSREHLQQIDEALWAAYRKYDRSAVMEKLLERFLRVHPSRVR